MLRQLWVALATTVWMPLAWTSEPGLRQVWTVQGANVLGAPTADGQYLTCFDPSSGDVAVLATATGKLRRLTNKGPAATKEFAWFSVPSRDGKKVAFAWFNDAGFYDLREVPFDGGEARVLYRNEESGFVQPTSWTPDGKQILTLFFRKDNISQIALVSSETGKMRVLRSLNWVYPKRMEISPDGRWIVYDSFSGDKPGPRDIFLLAMDGSRETRIVDSPGEDLFPSWAPDGRHIVFASDRSGTMDAWMLPVIEGRAAGAAQLIRRDLGQFLPMGVTTKGDLFYGVRSGTTDIVLMDPEGKSEVLPTRTPGRNSAPAWSRDGKNLAYLSRRGAVNFSMQGRVIVIRDMESGSERDLPAGLATVASLRWSPDGAWLLASGSDGKGRSGLFKVNVHDGSIRPQTMIDKADPQGLPGDWQTTGEIVADSTVRSVAVAPDGKTVARATDISVTAGDREWKVKGVTWLDWSGQNLLAAQGKTAILLQGSEVRPLNWKNYDGGPFSVHPNGQTIALATGGTRSEVWVMEHVFPTVDFRD